MGIRGSPMIVLILTLASAAALNKKFSAVAEKCCPAAAFQCCYNAIDFNLRLSCAQIPDVNRTDNEMIRCVQTELHGENDTMETGIGHLGCCQTFKNDQTDPRSMCYVTCRFFLHTPSFNSSEKLYMIEECRLTNPLYTCFNDCRTVHNENKAKGEMLTMYNETELCASYRKKKEEIPSTPTPLDEVQFNQIAEDEPTPVDVEQTTPVTQKVARPPLIDYKAGTIAGLPATPLERFFNKVADLIDLEGHLKDLLDLE
ncbi:hypothetical protein PRIPAC_95410 [Pristionchus pacificus]|uniref:Uncharacterized protein n=1 Tax=Pristionchus pacificus TaxID=54126 RepID=A0A454XKV8_PRIPA|nr:hypothetical protein PRIPAC_95410 [Pristionchus pacificus]|eukprot:PDM84004.1 hypothetical protein PRIPAC_34196 [Pristionchus pacificus]